MNTITLDLDQIKDLAMDADKIFLSAEGEEVLVKLLDAQKQIEDALTTAKAILEEEGLKRNPNFKGIQADKIRIGYRYFGAEYKIDEANIDKLPQQLYTAKTTYAVNNDELADYLETHKGLPLGILQNERKKTITITVKGGKDE